MALTRSIARALSPVASIVVLFGVVASASANECALSAAGQGRWYARDAERRQSYEMLGSVAAEATCDYRLDESVLTAKVFARLAQHGSERSHADVRELMWTRAGDRVRLGVGITQVFWGVMEFAHIVDTLNQSDVLEDPFGEIKLGQPMLSAALLEEWGTLSAFVLPRFRAREFPDVNEPLRAAPPVAIGQAQFESDRERDHWDYAFRYSLARGPLDLGLSYFDGTARDPDFLGPQFTPAGPTVFPYYPLIEQVGLDVQLTFGQWSLKFEGARREQAIGASDAHAIGIEYTVSGVGGTAADVTIAAEYMRDKRSPPAVPGFLDRDWGLGVRVALNDARSTDGKFGLIVDRARHSQAWALEFGSRIADEWRLAVQTRWFHNVSRSDPLWVIHQDSYVDIALTRYF